MGIGQRDEVGIKIIKDNIDAFVSAIPRGVGWNLLAWFEPVDQSETILHYYSDAQASASIVFW